jgi:hypothetical protein
MHRYRCSLTMIALLLLTVGGAGSRAQQAAPTPPKPGEGEAAPLAYTVSSSDPRLRYEGRFDLRDAAGPRCAWPASAVTLRFQGTGLNVRLRDSNNDEYQVVVDGQPSAVLVTRGGAHLYGVFHATADSLQQGPHTVTLVKRTEAFFGTTQFLGFQVARGGRLLPPPPRPARRLEVIGDSISCGYGNEAKDQHERFTSATENASLSYGAVAARAVGAEYACLAWSGRTMWPKNTMGEIYDKALPLDPGSRWDFARWTPDAVVVNLSTNDFSGGTPDRKGWIAGYETFLARVRRSYPRAAIYCTTSPMLAGSPAAVAETYLTQIVADENAAGDKNVKLLVFETQDGGKNGFGADWHPSVKTDAILAGKLAATLAADLGWTLVAAKRSKKNHAAF